VLSLAIAFQGLKMITRRYAKVTDAHGNLQLPQFAAYDLLNCGITGNPYAPGK
jgi:hypothetical protein